MALSKSAAVITALRPITTIVFFIEATSVAIAARLSAFSRSIREVAA
jgi:hypothetical protein